jgi:hypothetical protein
MTKTISFKKGTTVRVLMGEHAGQLAVVIRSTKFHVVCQSPNQLYQWCYLKTQLEKVES